MPITTTQKPNSQQVGRPRAPVLVDTHHEPMAVAYVVDERRWTLRTRVNTVNTQRPTATDAYRAAAPGYGNDHSIPPPGTRASCEN